MVIFMELKTIALLLMKNLKKDGDMLGFVPTKQRATGHIQELDLVFEKKID